jgi:chorismate mutase
MTEPELDRIRREIDSIDDALHDLVIRRTALIDEVIATKGRGSGANFRPAREAQILRRLIERHHGVFPKPVLARIWREIISASLGLQGSFPVAVYWPEQENAWRDLARAHFGSATRLSGHGSARATVHAVGEGNAAVGVVPLPEEDEAEPWWPMLMDYPGNGPKIVARLPFVAGGGGRGEGSEALAVGSLDPQPSGNDRSFLAVRAGAELSRARLSGALNGVGLEIHYMMARADPNDPDQTLFLVEVEGFIAPEDERLDLLVATDGLPAHQIDVLGAYATPFTAKDLEGRAAGRRDTER